MQTVTIETTISKSISEVWTKWTTPVDIMNWNFATDEWHCPSAEHELKVNGAFKYHMAAKDGSMAFDFTGTFKKVEPEKLLEFTFDDGRNVKVSFEENDGLTTVIESFEVEDENSIDMQRQGWQAILDNFKKYAESN